MLISYSAAQDPFHAIFRVLGVLESSDRDRFELDRVLITDFFVCFPWAVHIISGSRKVPGFISAQNRVVRTFKKNSYEQIPEPKIMFKRMRPAQLAALNSLSSYGYINSNEFKNNFILRTEKPLPLDLAEEVKGYVSLNILLFDFLNRFLNELPMSTSDGLKAKTGLEEFRYDYV